MSLEATALLSSVAVFVFTLLTAIAVMVAGYYPSPLLNRAAGYLSLLAALTSGFSIYFSGQAFDAFKRESELKIAAANKGAAEANDRAATLENANLVLRSQVATVEMRAENAGKEVVTLKIKLAEVTKRQTPRNLRIPSDMILSILKTAPPCKAIILYQQADSESALFAMGLQLRLRDAGWQILGFKAIPSSIVYGAGNEDIDFLMRDLAIGFPSDSVQALVRAMNAAAITVGGFGDPKLPDDTLRIIIHPKPS